MRNRKRTRLIFAFEILVCFVVTLVCILTGNYIDKGYNLAVGSVSTAKIVAPRQIENTFATEKLRKEAADSVTPLFKIDQNVSEEVNENIITLFEYFEERKVLLDEASAIAEAEGAGGAEAGEDSIEAENANDAEEQDSVDAMVFNTIISDEQINAYCALPRGTRTEIRDTILEIAGTIMAGGIKEEADTRSLLFVRDELNKKQWPSSMVNLGYSIVTSSLKPNLVVDDEATTAAKESKTEHVEPVILLQGQKIVDEGEIITDDAYWLLEAFDLIAENNSRNVLEIAGASAIILLIFALFICYCRYFIKKLTSVSKETTLLCLLYIFAVLLFRLMASVTFYIIPVTVPIILAAVLIDMRLSILFNILLVFTGALIYKGSPEFFLFFLVTGTVAVLVSKLTFERTKFVFAGLILCLANLFTVLAINAFYYKSIETELMFNGIIAVSNGLLSLIIAIGSLPIWEAMFDIITPIKLLDLTNPNNELLRKLTIEAPGTYHHSLIVANLAEQAAYDVGANAPLARVGGYYHDIGKLKYPYYFGENQVGENLHDRFDPYDSVRLIMQHVPLGLEYAEAYKLPRPIKDIILQHHGTTLVKFFYHKAKETYSEDYVKDSDFRYKGVVPNSKEAAIVMMADTAEAAVRSMAASSKSLAEVDAFLKTLIKSKLDDAQLDDSMLTLSELKTIRASFMKVFRGLYHERVKYPNEEKKSAHKAEKIKKSEVLENGN